MDRTGHNATRCSGTIPSVEAGTSYNCKDWCRGNVVPTGSLVSPSYADMRNGGYQLVVRHGFYESDMVIFQFLTTFRSKIIFDITTIPLVTCYKGASKRHTFRPQDKLKLAKPSSLRHNMHLEPVPNAQGRPRSLQEI